MNEQLDPENLLNKPVFIKNTDVTCLVTGYTYTAERCLVEVHFNYTGSKPCKTCFQMAESLKANRNFAYTDNCGPQMYMNTETIYTGVYDIKNLSSVPFGGPAAQLIYGQ